MTHRETFERLLDENPADWETRLIYADWLESEGDDFCECQRWMAENQKCPLNAAGQYRWQYSAGQHGLRNTKLLHYTVGTELYVEMVKYHPTRQAAERWLHEQLTKQASSPLC